SISRRSSACWKSSYRDRSAREADRRPSRSVKLRSPSALDPRQTGLDACVTLLDSPKIHRKRREIIDLGDRPSVLGEIERLHIAVAGVAGLDSDGRVFLVLEGRELVRISFEAGRTENATEEPFATAQGARQHSLGALHERT